MTTPPLALHPDRLFPPDPGVRRLAASLYERVQGLPIISPHGHVPPQWPDGPPQQVHLDFHVDDIGAAHAHAVSVGARVLAPEDGPDASRSSGFQVYADPAGHPFCLCW